MILLRKMLRDMLENKLAYVACIVVMAMGLMVYSAMNIVTINLLTAKDTFYDDYQMADVFINVQSIPNNDIEDLTKIQGVAKAQGVIKQDVRVNFEAVDENVYLRLISYDLDESDRINDVYLDSGYPLNDDDYLIWIGEDFLGANDLYEGDKIKLIISGKEVTFTIAGRVRSPEYVYATRNSYDFFPSPQTFDIAYVSQDMLEKLLGKQNTSTHVNVMLEEGYTYDDVRATLTSKMKPYGFISMFDLENQSSNAILDEELNGLISASQSVPFLFLGISCFILYIMLKRLTESQKGQIGILKAMGYHNYEILLHYIGYAVTIGLFSGLVGGLLGTQLSVVYTELYKQFFSFPTLENAHTWKYFGLGIILSVAFSLFAGYQGAKKILKLTPSMAMAPAAPKGVGRSLIERITPVWNLFTMQGKMALRNISRSKGRSFFTVIGLVFAFSIMVVTWSYNTMIDLMIFDQFDKVQLYDMKVSFQLPQRADELRETLYNIDGVEYAETVVEMPVQIKLGTHEKYTIIMGLDDSTQLYRVLDKDHVKVDITKEGLYLSENLAMQMNAKVGDVLRVESPIAAGHINMEIVGIIPQYIGSNGYASVSYLEKVTGLENIATTAYMNIDYSKVNHIRKVLDDSPVVGVIEVESQTLQKYTNLLDSYGFMIYMMALVSILVGFAIVYNSSVISLSERQREIASLRVLGMSVDEVLQIISFEQWILGACSVVIGIPMSLMMMQSLKASYTNDLYSVPSEIGQFAFILSIVGTGLFIWLSQVNVKRKIKRLEIVEVLKERE